MKQGTILSRGSTFTKRSLAFTPIVVLFIAVFLPLHVKADLVSSQPDDSSVETISLTTSPTTGVNPVGTFTVSQDYVIGGNLHTGTGICDSCGVLRIWMNMSAGSAPGHDLTINVYTSTSSVVATPEDASNPGYFDPLGTGSMKFYDMPVYCEVDGTPLSDCILHSGQTYYLRMYNALGAVASADFKTDGSGHIYYELYDTNGVPPANTTTRIVDSIPTASSTTATSAFSLGAQTYINHDEFLATCLPGDCNAWYIDVSFALQRDVGGGYALNAFNSAAASTTRYFLTTGLNSNSSPVSGMATGTYSVSVKLHNDRKSAGFLSSVAGFFGLLDTTLVEEKHFTFTVVAPNSYDNLVASTTAALNSFGTGSGSAFTECSAWTSFDLLGCLTILFVPSASQMGDVFNNLKTGFLTKAPWGYLTRVVTILSGSATSTLPTIDATIPLGNPGTSGFINDHFTLDPNEMMNGGSDMISNVHTTFGVDKTLREVTEPIIQLVIYSFLIFGIVHHLVGMTRHSSDGGKKGKLS